MSGWLAGQAETADRLNDNHPRTIDYSAIIASTAISTSNTELVAITTPTITFRNGRAFRLTFKGIAANSVSTDQINLKIRKTNSTTNPSLLDSFRMALGSSGSYLFFFQNIVVNTSGADIAVPLVGTYNRVVGGTGNINIFASAVNPAYLETQDIGDANDFPSAATMT
jgi:hypothetical protein